MAKFNIGDHVFIANDLHEGHEYLTYVNITMEGYSGKEAIIREVLNRDYDAYTLNILTDDEPVYGRPVSWVWTNDMLMEVNPENSIDILETVMDKSVPWERDDKFIDNIREQTMELLAKYGYPYSTEGINKELETYIENKGWILSLFSKHPNYNGKGQIVFESDFERPVDKDKLYVFKKWIDKMTIKELKKKELKVGFFTWEEYNCAMRYNLDMADNLIHGAVYNGMTSEMYRAEYERMRRVANKICPRGDFTDCYDDCKLFYVRTSDYEFRINLLSWADVIIAYGKREKANVIDGDCAMELNKYAGNIGISTKAIVGQKITKYANKVFVELGFNHDVEMVEKRWVEQDGTERSRMVDMGYNFQKANLGDAITPLKYKRTIVISAHFVDFLTMSFGYKWASCMTIDKTNKRDIDSNSYEGMYSGGTLSYALDNSTFITYIRPTEKELENVGETGLSFEEQSKFKRCLFMMGEDKLIQSRVYPDGRDGGDEGIAKQIRTLVQQVLSDLFNVNNLWKIKTGIDACCSEIRTANGACHYRDYAHYSDCNVTYLKRNGDALNHKKITIGHKSICPCCGEEHSNEGAVVCESCYEEGYCAMTCPECGDYFNPHDERAVRTVDESRFCCSGCAESAGYVYACDTEDWRRQNDCTYEQCSEQWYYYDQEGVWVDDYWYHDTITADENGNTYCEYDGCWANDCDATEIGNTGRYYNCYEHSSTEIEAEDGCMFPNERSAIDNGYRYVESQDIWVSEDDYGNYVDDDDVEDIA